MSAFHSDMRLILIAACLLAAAVLGIIAISAWRVQLDDEDDDPRDTGEILADWAAEGELDMDMTAPAELARLTECPEGGRTGGEHAAGCSWPDWDADPGTGADGHRMDSSAPVPVFPGEFTEEHMERLVLALTESPEAWRRRMEAESASWRTTVSTGLGLAVDFGDPLCLAVA